MPTLICPNRDVLADYVLGRLAVPDLAAIASHVEACTACGRQLETLDGLSDTVVTCLRRAIADGADSNDALLSEVLSTLEFIPPVSGSTMDAPVQEIELPTQIGQYQLIEKLGQGGMGTVYKALHGKLKRTVAVKLLPAHRQRAPQAISRFHREMEAVGRVDHPNIVRAHDAGEADGQLFLVMELVEGTTLASLVRRRGPLTVADACEVVRQAAVGLQHAHEHGLVHRDVKPSNLMLTAAGVVKVLDLGLARLQVEACTDPDATGSSQVVGTADYMAPEQGSSPREADARADVYALGCTLYCCLTGTPPFGDPRYGGFLAKVMAHINEAIVPIDGIRPDVPGGLSALLDRMLAKSPAERCATAAEVAELLAPFCAGSDLAGLLVDREQARAIGPIIANSTDSGTRDAPLPSSKWSPIVAFLSTYKTWLIGAAAGLVAIAGLWYGISMLSTRSATGLELSEQNGRGTQLAQLQGDRQPNAGLPPGGQRSGVVNQDAEVVSAYLRRTTVAEPVRAAMLTVVRQHPGETRWSGRAGTTLFGIAARRLPEGKVAQRTVPALLELTHMWAVHELLTAKSLLDRYAALGLTDSTTLRQAVVEAAGTLRVSGKASTLQHQGAVEGGLAISYATAEEAALKAQLLQPDEIDKVRIAYRNVMHRRARELMQRSNWSDALLLWQHLHKRQLVSQQLYLDAARCFKELDKDADTIRVLTEAIETFGKDAAPEFLENAGDMALDIETEQAQALAEKAYRLASEQLRETVSSSSDQESIVPAARQR